LAQSNVYSVNIVGYVNKGYPAGDPSIPKQFSLAVNPLKTTNNKISEVIPNPPDFTIVHRWNSAEQKYFPSVTYISFSGGWGDPNIVLDQGQAYFIQNASGPAWTNTYVGEVVLNKTTSLTNYLVALPNDLGLNLVGSAFPIEGKLTALQFPTPNSFDVAYIYDDGVNYKPAVTYIFGTWGSGPADEPTLKVAQGMFYKAQSPLTWVQNFTVN
jgi:hypothetical protein